jgi:hypothetical protein
MRSPLRSSIRLLTVLAVVALAYGTIAAFQSGGGPGARTSDGRPNLNGIWQALNTANWDIEAHEARPGPPQLGALLAAPAGLGVVDGSIPYQPWAAAKKKENFDKRWSIDPEAKCYLPGVPRATYMPFPFQIAQATNKIVMVYEYAAIARTIHMVKVPEAPIDSWMGHSVGRWDGQTLVVNVTDFNGSAWFDRAGNFQSESLHVVERYTPIDANTLNYEATIEDPKMYTRPWTMRMPLYRRQDKSMQLLDFRCIPFAEELLYGSLRKTPLSERQSR